MTFFRNQYAGYFKELESAHPIKDADVKTELVIEETKSNLVSFSLLKKLAQRNKQKFLLFLTMPYYLIRLGDNNQYTFNENILIK